MLYSFFHQIAWPEAYFFRWPVNKQLTSFTGGGIFRTQQNFKLAHQVQSREVSWESQTRVTRGNLSLSETTHHLALHWPTALILTLHWPTTRHYNGSLSTAMAHYCHLSTRLVHLALHWPTAVILTLHWSTGLDHLALHWPTCVWGELLGGEIEYNLLFKPICLLSALGP